MNTPSVDRHDLERETKRLTERYVNEVIVRLDLCPWAAPALERGSVQISVITDHFDADSLASAARVCSETLAPTPSEIEIVLLVLPRLEVRRLDMDALLGTLRNEMSQREREASFAVAAFHPDAAADTTSGERFIPFLRRSPDPMVQAVRFASLKRLEDKHAYGTTFLDPTQLDPTHWTEEPAVSLRARIAKRNMKHVLDQGLEDVKRRLDEICEDRQRTHRELGLVR